MSNDHQEPYPTHGPTKAQRKSSTGPLVLSLGTLLAMGTLTAYSPTLYEIFCQVTGFGGTTQRVAQADVPVLDRTIKVRFDANVAAALPWSFRPETREVEVKLGEVRNVSYRAKNEARDENWGMATFNVSPPAAGAYFNKIACFCFNNQGLKPGESVDMPVQFFVDPAILEDEMLARLPTITLSYTFFPDNPPEKGEKDETAAVSDEVSGGNDADRL